MIAAMAAPREVVGKAAGVGRWLGVGGRRATLAGEVVVISPHLDDGPFSLGAALSWAARAGANVTVLTVLAGDPESDLPAGEWDLRAGFRSEGEAATARRAEDAEACRLLGVEARWLPFGDHQYDRHGSDDEIRAVVVEASGEGLVLLPGFPLLHPDHRWLYALFADAFDPARVGFYVEQPYAAYSTDRPGVGQTEGPVLPVEHWKPLRAGLFDQRRKRAACQAYRSQLPQLGEIYSPIVRYELRAGGESAVLP